MSRSPCIDGRLLARGVLAASILVAPASTARAEPTRARGDGETHHRFVIGANGVALGAISHGHVIGEFGSGGFFELCAIPNWIEIELGVHYLRTTTKTNEVP